MAKIYIPYMLRTLVAEIGGNLEMDLGVPMNAELPPSTDGHSEGTAAIHFPGTHFVVRLETGRGHYGQYVRILSIRCQLSFYGCQTAEDWLAGLEQFSGPLDSEWKETDDIKGKLCFTLEGMSLARLEMNASNRRNDLPVYEWADPENPLRKWAADRGIVY